jgi:serine kinase of HPr protein (carbohydrate metabolism regulator)
LPDAAELVHGTCVALGRSAALLRGPSGSGKSDLALRFLFLARRGPAALEPPTLVADDQVRIRRDGSRLLVEAPATLRGKLEVRGLGIVEMKSAADAELVLVADLVASGEVERMPDADAKVSLLGIDVAAIRLAAAEPSAPIKLALALARARKT